LKSHKFINVGESITSLTGEACLTWMMVQALIGNNGWKSVNQNGGLYHVGTIPNLKGNIYATNLRFMIDWVIISMLLSSCHRYVCWTCLPLAKKLGIRTNSRGPFALCRNGEWVQSTLRWGKTMWLAHEVAHKTKNTIQQYNYKLRLKKRQETL
jgi:hypothetical protein